MLQLPTIEALKILPLRTIVAYAARCARRVLPLYQCSIDTEKEKEYVKAIDRAIKIAEQFANGCMDKVTTHAPYEAAYATTDQTAFASAYTAAHAVNAAHAAYNAVNVFHISHYGGHATLNTKTFDNLSYDATALAAYEASKSSYEAGATYVDFPNLLNVDTYPGLGSPVDCSESGPFGPLWPFEAPDWYKEGLERINKILGKKVETENETEVNSHAILPELPALPVLMDPGTAPPDLIREIYLTLDALYQSQGGSGLKIVNDDPRVVVREEVRR